MSEYKTELISKDTEEEENDPFSDLIPSNPSTPKPSRSLEDSVTTLSKASHSGIEKAHGVMSKEDQVVYDNWLCGKVSEPPEALRLMLDPNFRDRVSNSLMYLVADATIRANHHASYNNAIEAKLFDLEVLNRYNSGDTELIALHERSSKTSQENLKFITGTLKEHPQLFDASPKPDPNPQIAELNRKLQEFSPAFNKGKGIRF